MSSSYPAQIDIVNIPVVSSQSPLTPDYFNTLRGAIIAIEQTVGVNPASTYGTVGATLISLQNSISSTAISLNTGDLGGTNAVPLVIGLQGYPVSSQAPGLDNVLTWTGSSWTPVPSASIFMPAGDLSGNGTSQTVIGLRNNPISSQVPVTNDILSWNGSVWIPTLFAGDITGGAGTVHVVKINGANVPAAGSLVPGSVLQVNGSNSLTYTFLNLADGYVTGILPVTNLPSLLGDVTGTIISNTVIQIQGNPVHSQSLGASQDGYTMVWHNAGPYWEALPAPTGFTASGDLSGSAISQTVVALQGNAVKSGTLIASQDGYVLTWHNASSQWEALPETIAFIAGGDLSGSYSSQEVVGLLGHPLPSLSDGYLYWNGAAWQFYVLPTSYPPDGSAGGDLSGFYPNPTVAKIEGNPVLSQVLGALQDGYILTWHNAGGYWEALPNSSSSTVWNNDLVNSSISSQYVSSLSYSSSAAGGTIAINGTSSALQWSANNAGPVFNQNNPSNTNTPAAGSNFTIAAQTGTSAVSGNNNGGNGGELILSSGSGGTKQGSGSDGTAGSMLLQAGGATQLTIAPALVTVTSAITLSNYGTGIAHLDSSGNVTSSLNC